ncbi:retrovirus-related pol polyprotein from transposon TNT 1-94 [Tanacetum coccineum]
METEVESMVTVPIQQVSSSVPLLILQSSISHLLNQYLLPVKNHSLQLSPPTSALQQSSSVLEMYYNLPPRTVSPDPVAIVASRAVDPVGSPSSTTIDQDEQSTSTSPTNQEIQSQVTHQGPVPQFMAPDHSSSGPVLHEMTSDQIRSDLTPNRQETSVDNISSDLVSNKQKASDYDISGPVPPRKNVVSLADKTDSSQKEIEFLFNHFFEEYFSPINVHAEENNNDQAANASPQVWELVYKPFGKTVIKLKWLWKNKKKEDEVQTVIRNKAILVAKGYAQEEGTDFEESFCSKLSKAFSDVDMPNAIGYSQSTFRMDTVPSYKDGKVRSKCENKGIVPTEMELVLEYTQQGASHEVSEHLKMEMEIPCSNKIKFITACSFSNDTFEDIMKAQVSVIKASATLNIQAFKIKKSVSISFRMTQVHKMAKDHMMMIRDYDWMMISKKLKDHIQVKLKPKSLKFTASDSQDTDQ